TAQHSTAQHSTDHSTAQHSTAQQSFTEPSTTQHSTAQHRTAQHSTAQHSTAQPRDLSFCPILYKRTIFSPLACPAGMMGYFMFTYLVINQSSLLFSLSLIIH